MALQNCKICKINDFSRWPCGNCKICKINDFRDGLAKTAKFEKLTIRFFTTTLRFIIHVNYCIIVFNFPTDCLKYCYVLSQLYLRVNNFFRVKTLHMICLKLGLNVINFQGTGPWSKIQILTAVQLEIDSSRKKEIFSMLANRTLINKTIVHWELIRLQNSRFFSQNQ